MLETERLYLAKARESDWEPMLRNVWSHPESARYMTWRVTETEEDAKARILRTLEFQKTHNTYFVYEKVSGEPIGFAGAEEIEPGVWEESGICLGPAFTGKGCGREILRLLIDRAKAHGAKEFRYFAWEENAASRGLAASFGFVPFETEDCVDERSGAPYRRIRFRLEL